MKAAREANSQDLFAMKSRPMNPAPYRTQHHQQENAKDTQAAAITPSRHYTGCVFPIKAQCGNTIRQCRRLLWVLVSARNPLLTKVKVGI